MVVIDLTSSPTAVCPAMRKSNAVPKTVPNAAKRMGFGNERTEKRIEKETIKPFCLSDDSDKDPFISTTTVRKPHITLSSASTKMSTHKIGNLPDDFWSLDSGEGGDGKSRPVATAIGGMEGVSRRRYHDTSVGKDEGKGRGKSVDDFFLLSDDFDTSINLEESFRAWEPTRKRIRLTPEVGAKAVNKRKGLARAISDVGALSKANIQGSGGVSAKTNGLKRSKTSVLDDDPIVFTSSPHAVRFARETKAIIGCNKVRELGSDEFLDILDLDRSESSTRRKPETQLLDDLSSGSDLPDLGKIGSQLSLSELPPLSRKESQKALATYNAEKAAGQKSKDKARTAQQKLQAKEAEKERKRLEKEDKAREKQMAADLARVNTLRDKKMSAPEMIVELPAGLEPRLAAQTRQFLAPLEVECTEWNSPVPNVIRWRRKVEATYNEEMGHWEPCPKHIKAEKHIMCIMAAKEFVDLVTGDEDSDLDAHVLSMQAAFPSCTFIYLLEGLEAWQRKNRNVRNRQFTEAMRSQIAHDSSHPPPSSSTQTQTQKSSKRKRKPPPEYISEDLLEDSLLRLQVQHDTLIQHSASLITTAEQITVLTTHISTIPYRLTSLEHQPFAVGSSVAAPAGFCMQPGQIRAGVDATDTYARMLMEVSRVTRPVADAVLREFGNVCELVEGFEREGKGLLSELRKGAGAGGDAGDAGRRVGERISRRLWGIFMGRDEWSTDV